MLTQDEVIAELNARGYEITPRRLVDWRQKGLLPPLVKRGRGQGQGWVYVWEDPLVIEQAVAVQELLWLHERTGWLYVPLWCLGFEVPLERVRSQLLARLGRSQSHLTGGNEDPVAIADTVSALAFDEATRPGPRQGRRGSADVLEYWLNLLVGDADYAPDWQGWGQVAAELTRFMGWDAADTRQEETWITSPAGLRLIRRWTRRYASLPRLEEAALDATESQWDAVHADWQALRQLTRTLEALSDEDTWQDYHDLWLRVVAVAGPWLSLVDLSMRQRGKERVWDDLRSGLVTFVDRLDSDPEIQQQIWEDWHDHEIKPDTVEGGENHTR